MSDVIRISIDYMDDTGQIMTKTLNTIKNFQKGVVSAANQVLKAEKNINSSFERMNKQVTQFDRTTQKTLFSLQQMVNERYQVTFDVIDRITPVIEEIQNKLSSRKNSIWNVTLRATDMTSITLDTAMRKMKNYIGNMNKLNIVSGMAPQTRNTSMHTLNGSPIMHKSGWPTPIQQEVLKPDNKSTTFLSQSTESPITKIASLATIGVGMRDLKKFISGHRIGNLIKDKWGSVNVDDKDYLVDGSGIVKGLADVGEAMGVRSKSGGKMAAAGATGIASTLLTLYGLFDAGHDMYKAKKMDQTTEVGKREAEAYRESGKLKIHAIGIGASLGTAILPGLGTAIGAGLGYLGGKFFADKELKEFEKSKYESQEMKDAIDNANLSAEELAATFQKAVGEDMRKNFGKASWSIEQIQNYARRITIGDKVKEMQQFAEASAAAENSLQNLNNSTSNMERMNRKFEKEGQVTEEEQEVYKQGAEQLLSDSRQYLVDNQYEFIKAAELLGGVSEGSKGAALLERSNQKYEKQQRELDGLGDKYFNEIEAAFEDGKLKPGKMDAIQEKQSDITQYTEKAGRLGENTQMDVIRQKYGGAGMNAESFGHLQEQLGAYGAEQEAAYDQAYAAVLDDAARKYGKDSKKYNEVYDYFGEEYQKNMGGLQNNIMETQMKFLLDSEYGKDLEKSLNTTGLKGSTSEQFMQAMKNSMADGKDVRTWPRQDAAKYLGMEDLNEESQAGIAQIISGMANSIPGFFEKLMEGGEKGRKKEEGGGTLPDKEKVIYGPASNYLTGNSAFQASPSYFPGQQVKEYLNSRSQESGLDTGSSNGYTQGLTTPLYGPIQSNLHSAPLQSTASYSAASGIAESAAINMGGAAIEGAEEIRTMAQEQIDGTFTEAFEATATINVTASWNLLNPFNFNFVGGGSAVSNGSKEKRSADGRFVDGPMLSWIGEDGPEVVIPLGSKRRQRGIDLWERAGNILGIARHAAGGIAGGALAGDGFAVYDEEGAPSTMPVPAGGSGDAKVEVNVNMSPSFQISGEGSDENSIVTVLKNHIRDMADEVGDELADRLQKVFSNMPAKEA